MELKRKPFQGVWNIIRFNRHFYLAACIVLTSLIIIRPYLPGQLQTIIFWMAVLAALSVTISLLVSLYVYDLSDLYRFRWLPDLTNKKILNINAGFDETSAIITNRFPQSVLTICDFYHPDRHTEISIRRARKAYPPHPHTIPVSTNNLPFGDHSFDYVLAILSAHEIRDEQERIHFFKELSRVTTPTGQIFVTEHLRDFNNGIAYTFGFFHFHSKAGWLHTFAQANLVVKAEIKTTPFVTTFILEQYGDSL